MEESSVQESGLIDKYIENLNNKEYKRLLI